MLRVENACAVGSRWVQEQRWQMWAARSAVRFEFWSIVGPDNRLTCRMDVWSVFCITDSNGVRSTLLHSVLAVRVCHRCPHTFLVRNAKVHRPASRDQCLRSLSVSQCERRFCKTSIASPSMGTMPHIVSRMRAHFPLQRFWR